MPPPNLPELTPGTTYEFCGDGLGIPGLSHHITTEEAQALDVADILRAALDNGSYRAVDAPATLTAPVPTTPALEAPATLVEE